MKFGWLVDEPLMLMAIAGILFASWPFPLDKAGFKGLDSPTAFALGQLIYLLCYSISRDIRAHNPSAAIATGVIVFILASYAYLKLNGPGIRWDLLAFSCIMSSTGLICMMRMLGLVTTAGGARSLYLAGQILISGAVSMAIYLAFNPKDITYGRLMGFVMVFPTIILIYTKGNR